MRAPSNKYNFAQGLSLNGTNQYATVGAVSGVTIPTSFSFVTWFRFTKTPPEPNCSFLCNTGSAVSDHIWTFRYVRTSASPYFSFEYGPTGGSIRAFNSQTIMWDFEIHQLAITRDSSDACGIYLDGKKLTHTVTPPQTYPSTFTNLHVGLDQRQNGARNFPGVIGEERLITQVISEQDIIDNWNKGRGSNNLDKYSHFLLYKLENTNDSSGNGRNLTLVNSPTFTTF